MTDFVETVARAMAQKDAEDEGLKFPTSPTAYRTYMGLARAAIGAYEKAKREAAEPHVVRVEKGVTYWSNGLCSQSVPGSKEFAEDQIKAKFDEQPRILRDWKEKP